MYEVVCTKYEYISFAYYNPFCTYIYIYRPVCVSRDGSGRRSILASFFRISFLDWPCGGALHIYIYRGPICLQESSTTSPGTYKSIFMFCFLVDECDAQTHPGRTRTTAYNVVPRDRGGKLLDAHCRVTIFLRACRPPNHTLSFPQDTPRGKTSWKGK